MASIMIYLMAISPVLSLASILFFLWGFVRIIIPLIFAVSDIPDILNSNGTSNSSSINNSNNRNNSNGSSSVSCNASLTSPETSRRRTAKTSIN